MHVLGILSTVKNKLDWTVSFFGSSGGQHVQAKLCSDPQKIHWVSLLSMRVSMDSPNGISHTPAGCFALTLPQKRCFPLGTLPDMHIGCLRAETLRNEPVKAPSLPQPPLLCLLGWTLFPPVLQRLFPPPTLALTRLPNLRNHGLTQLLYQITGWTHRPLPGTFPIT